MATLFADIMSTESESDVEEKAFRSAYMAEESTVTFKGQEAHVIDYEPLRLSTIMLFFTWKGTVFRNGILWVEQALVLLLFTLTAWYVKNSTMSDANAEKDAGSLADKMATLAAFLLGFYTSLTVSRWWRLRTDGIGNIWSATSQLSLFLSQFVTKDKETLDAVRRYARASMAIVFLKRKFGAQQLYKKLDTLVDEDILFPDEVNLLRSYNNNLAESIWTWVAHIVADLNEKGKIKGEVMLNFLMERVNLGRGGAALIGAQMGTPIPLPYIHLIGFLVKIHNLILGLSLGFIMGCQWDDNVFARFLLPVKVFCIPLLYNAILLVNAGLADPFNGEVNDFPFKKYELGIEGDGLSYVQAGEHLPAWMKKQK